MPFIALDPLTAAAAPTTSLGTPRTSVGKTLSKMRADLARMLNRPGDTATQLDSWINDAYLDVCTSLKIDELKGSLALSLVAGQPFYLLPYVVHSTMAVGLNDPSLIGKGQPLEKSDRETYRTLPDETGRPCSYFRENDMLVFYPTPESSYIVSVDFRIRPLPLTEDTDSPIIGEEWHRSILLRARQFAFDDLQEFDKTPLAENSANNSMRRRTDTEAEEDSGRIIRSSVPGRSKPWRSSYRREY